MKRLPYILLVLALAMLTRCTKKPELKVYIMELGAVDVEVTSSSVTVSADYSYPTEIGEVRFLVSGESGMGGALESVAEVTDTKLTGTVTGLLPSTKYYFCFRYSTGVNLDNTEPGSFTTQNSGGGSGELSVTTLSVASITATTAVSGGNVTGDGGYEVTMRGVCWNTDGEPTIVDSHTEDGTGTGVFLSNLTGLEPDTDYHLRAYAINEMDTVYGETLDFTTQNGGIVDELAVTTLSVASITTTTAVSGGNVTGDGGYEVTMRGVCWNKDGEPTIADSRTEDGTGTGVFLSNLIGLEPGAEYHVRAYAINEMDTVYGETIDFTTQSNVYGTVVTTGVSEITMTSAKASGNVTDDGGVSVFERGICWDTVANPTIEKHKVPSGSGMGAFTCNITDLTLNTKYHVRAYATNTHGTNYGDDIEFTTLGTIPVVTTVSVTDVTYISAKVKGNVANDWGSEVTERGVCYSISENPTTANNKITAGSGLGDFECELVDLTHLKTYYVRTYAINSYGVNYGEQMNFTTESAIVVTTLNIADITDVSAVFNGEAYVKEGSSAYVGNRGFCWNTEPNPTYDNNHNVAPGSGTGSFSKAVDNLTPGTTYYVRAWANATGGGGKVYGNEVSFTAGAAQLPTVTISEPANISYNGATLSGTAQGLVTERGFCYGTTHNPSIIGTHVALGSGSGSFNTTLSDLSENTTYYVRAYASNVAGVSYSREVSFTTTGVPLGDAFSYNFDNHSIEGWNNVDADGDGHLWVLGTSANLPSQGSPGHNSSADFVFSASFDNSLGALTPDNYLVSERVTIGNTATFSFWACAQDQGWPSEHFGVAVSTAGNISPSSFTMVQEWTLTAKDSGKRSDSNRSGKEQGTWRKYTVDLSSYSGQQVYIAIRHFNSTDQFMIDVDDIELTR